MNGTEVSTGIMQVLRSIGVTAEIAIVDGAKIDLPGAYLAIGANDPISIDNIQSIMVMVGLPFVKWHKDQYGEFMLYRVA